MEEENFSKLVDLSVEEAKTIMTVFVLSAEAHKKKPFLYEEEIIAMEIFIRKLKKVFFPDEYNKTLH